MCEARGGKHLPQVTEETWNTGWGEISCSLWTPRPSGLLYLDMEVGKNKASLSCSLSDPLSWLPLLDSRRGSGP